jgi:predicted DNA-binding transcriptional regulator AlpA
MASTNVIESFLTDHDVSRITKLSLATVRRWRRQKKGPPYIKIGAAVRYKPESLSAWLQSRPTGGEQSMRSR